jgi:hypothetical protein
VDGATICCGSGNSIVSTSPGDASRTRDRKSDPAGRPTTQAPILFSRNCAAIRANPKRYAGAPLHLGWAGFRRFAVRQPRYIQVRESLYQIAPELLDSLISDLLLRGRQVA